MLRRKALIGLLLALALVAAACGDDDSADDTSAPLATAAPVTTVAATTTMAAVEVEFDLVAAVADYTNNIPEGWLSVSDLTAFKDAIAAGAFVVDVRETGEYAEGHIADSINIPLRTLTQNLELIPTDRQVFVYCKSGYRAALAGSSLHMLGYDNVLVYSPSWLGWTGAGEPVSMDPVVGDTYTLPDMAPEMFAAVDGFVSTIPEGWLTAGDVEAVKTAAGAGAFLLDIRTPGEYAEGYIPGAVNLTLREIPDLMDAIPADQQVIAYCKSGYRCALAVPVLHVLGFDTAKCFTGSWLAWVDAGEPIEGA
jgi:rhodanese-related sulfurtransferase